jgi:anionic cell wall polymer biosynthesis LytR-Cps2A-Psr (LCP) family protein
MLKDTEQQKKGKKTRFSVLILIAIVLILGITGRVLFVSLKIDSVDESLIRDPILKTLFVLEDRRTVLATDVFLYYPPLNRGVMFDVPGNIGSIFTSLGRVDRIDAIYHDKGVAAYTREIEKLFGQQIPFTLTFTLESFCRLADYLGGLKIFVPSPVDVIGTDGTRFLLPSGSVILDGDKVRTFITYTSHEETPEEVQNRREKLMAAFLEALNARSEYLENDGAFRTLAPLFSSRMNDGDLRHLLREIARVDAEQLHPQSVRGNLQQVDSQWLLFPEHDGQLIKDVTLQTITTLVSQRDAQYNRTYVLEILNGTSAQGLARNTASLLQMVGFSVFRTGNAENNGYERTVIIDRIGNFEVAKSIGDFIRCANIVEEEVLPESATPVPNEAYVDFTIILGRDFDGRAVRGE